MAIYSGFSHWKWWFSIAMLNYQRVILLNPQVIWYIVVIIYDWDWWGILMHDIATIEFLQAEHWNRATASMQGTDHPGGYHSPSETCCTGESWLNALIWTNDFRVCCQMILTFCSQLRSQGFSEFVFNNLYRNMAGTTTLRPFQPHRT